MPNPPQAQQKVAAIVDFIEAEIVVAAVPGFQRKVRVGWFPETYLLLADFLYYVTGF
jgi:hypothetical protein